MKAFLWMMGVLFLSLVQANALDRPHWETQIASDTAWDGTKYMAYPVGHPKMTVQRVTIPANGALPWHKHPMPCVAYVLSGTMTIEKHNGDKSKPYGPGQAVAQTVDEFHRAVAGNEEVQYVMFFSGIPGMPVMIKEGEEKLRP